MIRFLEREGYDVTYSTDVDTHENGRTILNHKGMLVVGHDEYWSWPMRDNVEGARDKGLNVAFFAANTSYWQVRRNHRRSGPDDSLLQNRRARARPLRPGQ
jgi:hypothetical protein